MPPAPGVGASSVAALFCVWLVCVSSLRASFARVAGFVSAVLSAALSERRPLPSVPSFFLSSLFFEEEDDDDDEELLFVPSMRPMLWSLAGTSVAFAGMEFSYSCAARSRLAFALLLRLMPSVDASVGRSFSTSGIQ